jgi:cbb3-type cytochrome oxidase subunit 3
MSGLQKMLRVLETVWLVIGFVGLGSFIYSMVGGRRDQGIYFLAFTFIAGVMYLVRKRQRKRAEADAKKNNQL